MQNLFRRNFAAQLKFTVGVSVDGDDNGLAAVFFYQLLVKFDAAGLVIRPGYVKSKKKIQVAIPAGIDNGQSIRIRAKGEPGINGGERGDLLVTVLVDRDPRFQRQEYDLYSSEPITFTQAALGGKITVTTIDGPYELEIKPGTQTDTKVKLKGKGVPTLRNKTVRGDHYITLVVQVPDKLTEEQKSILNQYANTTVNARSSTDAASSGSSIFGDHKRKKGFKKGL